MVFPARQGRSGLRRIAGQRCPSRACAASTPTAEKLRRVCELNPDGGRGRHRRPAHRDRLETPAPQGVGAVAAIERDDRAAIVGRVPRCRPATTVTEQDTRRKCLAAFRTHGARDRCAGRSVTATHRCRRTCSAEQPGILHMFPLLRDGKLKRRHSRQTAVRVHVTSGADECARSLPPRQPRAVVRSMPLDAAAAASGPASSATRVQSKVRMPVNGEAVTGDGPSARALSRGDARCRRSRQGRARRVPRGEHGAKRRRSAPVDDDRNERAAPAHTGTARRRAPPTKRPSARGFRACGLSRRGCR